MQWKPSLEFTVTYVHAEKSAQACPLGQRQMFVELNYYFDYICDSHARDLTYRVINLGHAAAPL